MRTIPLQACDRIAIIDELGELTYAELDRRANALARSFAADGVGEGDSVGIMCRNHRGFVQAVLASAKLGADALCLSTELAPPAVARVLSRERPSALVYDEEFGEHVRDVASATAFVAYCPGEGSPTAPLLESLVAQVSSEPLPAPVSAGRTIILTSGTTGTPKAAVRRRLSPGGQAIGLPAELTPPLPLREDDRMLIAVPLHHLWGYAQLTLGLALAATCVLRRGFDAQDTLRTIASQRISALVAVPLMLQRMLALPPAVRSRSQTGSLRMIAVSGSPLPGDLALEVMDAFGDVLYNLYGTTETGAVAIATPEDLRAAPGTAGRPPEGTEVRLLDAGGREVGPGQSGRIFVSNSVLFEGYTSGESRVAVDGLLSTGDIGHFDEAGRLFVDSREDDMIISGGENVYPRELEDMLVGHEQIAEAAVVGVPDEEFGQRLKAFVVPSNGGELTEERVKDFVRAGLARYKVPREVVFLSELPRNAAGKVLKRELVKQR
jgi:fatty-acyl-CoA synthase